MIKLPSAIGLALLGASLAGSSIARAEDTVSFARKTTTAPPPLLQPPWPASAPKPPQVIWYGWEPLVAAAGLSSLSFALLHSQPLVALTLGSILSR